MIDADGFAVAAAGAYAGATCGIARAAVHLPDTSSPDPINLGMAYLAICTVPDASVLLLLLLSLYPSPNQLALSLLVRHHSFFCQTRVPLTARRDRSPPGKAVIRWASCNPAPPSVMSRRVTWPHLFYNRGTRRNKAGTRPAQVSALQFFPLAEKSFFGQRVVGRGHGRQADPLRGAAARVVVWSLLLSECERVRERQARCASAF